VSDSLVNRELQPVAMGHCCATQVLKLFTFGRTFSSYQSFDVILNLLLGIVKFLRRF
jgi:hypothetical protein